MMKRLDNTFFNERLRALIKPELNNIYHEPPAYTSRGLDFGWFCREHALHLAGLGQLLGAEAEICVGDFIVETPEGDRHTSIGESGDHAWCSINGVEPIDLSISTHGLSDFPIPIVFGTERVGNSCFAIELRQELTEADLASPARGGVLSYVTSNRHRFDPIALHEQPYQFLIAPENGRLTELDSDIFFAITWHCFQLVRGNATPLFPAKNPINALKTILNHNTNAKDHMSSELRSDVVA